MRARTPAIAPIIGCESVSGFPYGARLLAYDHQWSIATRIRGRGGGRGSTGSPG